MITKTKSLSFTLCAAVLLILCQAERVHAAPTVSVVPIGDGLFTAHGIEFVNITAIDITITYDASAASNPQVVQGRLIKGAMMTVNDREPGTVRVTVFREPPISGTGAIVTFNFERKGEAQPKVTSVNARLTDLSGALYQARVQMLNSSDTPIAPGRKQADQMIPSSGVPAASDPSTPLVAPAVPSEAIVPPPAPSGTRPAESVRREPERAAGSTPQKKVVVTQKSVLDRFREHGGESTPQALIGLFEQDPLIGCRQEPFPILADGAATATVTFIAPAGQGGAPNVALINASLASIERDRDNTNTWVATVQPHRNSTEAQMIISLKDKTLIIPLAVAPKVALSPEAPGALTEKDFAAFLRGGGGGGAPGRDLNGDGAVNDLDLYIYTANYLALRQKAGSGPSAGK